MGLPFFGLNPEYRINVFREVHDLVFHGGGGFIHSEVYDMPIWLRKFTFSELQSHYEKKNKPPDNLNTKQLVDKDGNVNVPEFAKTSAQYKRKSSYK